MSETVSPLRPAVSTLRRPRVGFLGVGWIGRLRMEAALATGVIDPVAIADPSAEQLAAALELAPGAAAAATLDDLLALDLDGLVIATPSALHAAQAIAALERGVAVFCQKPLGRTAAEAAAVVEAARRADRLLAVDLSYRFTEGMRQIRRLIADGALGKVFAADLVFHNAYGPDKPWFYDRGLSGGGCVMDLGVHLVDLALWVLDFPEVRKVESALYAAGAPLPPDSAAVEDYAVATLETADGATLRLACSWRLHAGQEADISATFYGDAGGARLRNVDGSFYEFMAERFTGTRRETLTTPSDDWGGRAAADWAERLAAGERFDPAGARLVDLARILDRINGQP
ncbi:Gfo/Idh/MocA family protein [Phenylobacterium sp.]|jgi:predicted dehydrogenase|uniref:Gfo/Idh/MocA family protein n=1 Tax=Phenylobacterium sp. TaxID=1871053 RepID=UPI003782DE42